MWRGIQKDCSTWAQACQVCQHSKASRHTVTPVGHFMLPVAHFFHIHIDLMGPLPTSAGYTYCLTVVDCFTAPHSGQHIQHRGMCPIDRLDIPLQLPADHQHRPETSVSVTTRPLPGQIVWNSTFLDNRPLSHSQQTQGTLAPGAEGSHHLPCRATVDRGVSPGSSQNLHTI
jgi:hypothetical protein